MRRIVVAVLGVWILGCSGLEMSEQLVQLTSGAQEVEITEHGMVIVHKDGGKMQVHYGEDVEPIHDPQRPPPPGDKVKLLQTMAESHPDGSVKSSMHVYELVAPTQEVVRFYEEHLEAIGASDIEVEDEGVVAMDMWTLKGEVEGGTLRVIIQDVMGNKTVTLMLEA
jgi:hypothetical protein